MKILCAKGCLESIQELAFEKCHEIDKLDVHKLSEYVINLMLEKDIPLKRSFKRYGRALDIELKIYDKKEKETYLKKRNRKKRPWNVIGCIFRAMKYRPLIG